jgi:hypothetical protein
MQVKYTGRFADDGVELHEREGGTWFAGHEPVDVTPELAARLLEQTENFEPADDEARALVAELVAERATETAPLDGIRGESPDEDDVEVGA